MYKFYPTFIEAKISDDVFLGMKYKFSLTYNSLKKAMTFFLGTNDKFSLYLALTTSGFPNFPLTEILEKV